MIRDYIRGALCRDRKGKQLKRTLLGQMKKPEYGICIRYYFISIKCLDFDQYPVLIEKFLFLKKKTKVFMDEGA